MNYVIGVQAAAFPISDDEFAVESAFGAHLHALKSVMAPEFDRVIMIAPRMTAQTYEAQRHHLAVIRATDGIVFVPGAPTDSSIAAFWLRHVPQRWRHIWSAIGSAGTYHTGMASDLYRPFMFLTNIVAWIKRPPTVFFIDIDSRRNSERSYAMGIWNYKSYVINRLIHDPFRWLQIWLATRTFDLCLLKSKALVRDFGRGKPNILPFLDTAHSADAVLTQSESATRQQRLRHSTAPLEVVYFGRLVAYKGLLLSLEAVASARRSGADVRMRFIGAGEMSTELKLKVAALGIDDAVTFIDPVPYGPQLFQLLDQSDVMIATPMIEDTPRAAVDAMARGLPIVAFDTEYFSYLRDLSGAIALGTWPLPEAVGQQLAELHADRNRLADMSGKAVEFARENTQEEWLRRRAAWVRKFCLRTPAPVTLPTSI